MVAPKRTRLTAERIAAFTCPPGKSQAFLWDTDAPALAVRAAAGGRKTYVFERRLNGKTLRVNIGATSDWTIEQARSEARRLAVLVDGGSDPRELERQQQAERAAQRQQEQAQAVTMGEAWAAYVTERRPHWGERHYLDNLAAVRAGGEPFKRGQGTTKPGPLHALLALPLRELDATAVEAWAAREAQARPTQARLALRLLRAFLGWCTEHPQYSAATPDKNPANSRRAREALGKAGVKSDALLREQLPGWFAAVRGIGAAAPSAYLQTLLLTGARPGEVLTLRWEDVNTQWRGLTIRDKVEGERVIPLAPYVHHLLAGLPRRGPFVFAGTSDDKPMARPHRFLLAVGTVAGVGGLTLHGLRRSFKSLSEWLELPAGVVAQIMGHKPSATAEKHYTVRPLDLLRVHHEKIEAWILRQAGVPFVPVAASGKLALVAG